MLVLLEFIILTIPYLYTFLYQIDLPSRKPPSENSSTLAPLTFSSYACQVFKVWDVFGTLNYNEANQPLAPKL